MLADLPREALQPQQRILATSVTSPQTHVDMAQDEISRKVDDVWSRACRVIADLSRYDTPY